MFYDNKYTNCYYRIVSRARDDVNNRTTGYFELHHVIPKALGGSNRKSNLVKLTAREHYVCHLLLTKMTNHRGMSLALVKMTPKEPHPHQERYKPPSKLYEYARRLASIANSGSNNGMYGKNIHHDHPEIGLKISAALRASENFKASRANPEWRKKISDVQSTPVELVTADGRVVGTWRNCTDLAAHLGCTRANVKAARRDQRPLGKKAGLSEPCFVRYA